MKGIELRPTWTSRILLAPIALIAASIVYLGNARSSPIVAAIAAAAVLIGYVALCAALGRRRIVVDDRGVRGRGALGGAVEMTWAEIRYYAAWSALAKGGPVSYRFEGTPDRRIDGRAAKLARHFLVVHADGRAIVVDSGFRDPHVAIAAIVARLDARPRADARFAPFAIGDGGLAHDGAGELPWSELERVEVRHDGRGLAPRIKVLKAGKAFPWAIEPMSGVHDGYAFLERLAERGVALELGDTLAPATLARRVAANHARAAQLPRAEVVQRE